MINPRFKYRVHLGTTSCLVRTRKAAFEQISRYLRPYFRSKRPLAIVNDLNKGRTFFDHHGRLLASFELLLEGGTSP